MAEHSTVIYTVRLSVLYIMHYHRISKMIYNVHIYDNIPKVLTKLCKLCIL